MTAHPTTGTTGTATTGTSNNGTSGTTATGTAAAVADLSERWTRAELAGDVETLDSLLHHDFLAVGPLGFLLTKDQWLDRHRSGNLTYTALSWEDAAVRDYGDTAVSVATQRQRATFQGRDIPGTFRVTQIAVRDGRHWHIAGVHLSAISVPPGAPGGPGQGGAAARPGAGGAPGGPGSAG